MDGADPQDLTSVAYKLDIEKEVAVVKQQEYHKQEELASKTINATGNKNSQDPATVSYDVDADKNVSATEQQECDKQKEVASNTIKTTRKKTSPPTAICLKKRNKCFIFSNQFLHLEKEYQTPQNRIDAKRIEYTFEWLNFDVEIFVDSSRRTFQDEFGRLLCDEYEDCECIAFFFLTHGWEDKLLFMNDKQTISVDYVITKLINSKALQGKIKLIFVQACRGRGIMEAVVKSDQYVRAGGKAVTKKAKDADVLTYYGTTEGNRTWGNHKVGSYFIYTLCQVLQDYGGDYSLDEIIIKVNELCAEDVRLNQNNTDIVSVGEVIHSLTYKIYFSPIGEFTYYLRQKQNKTKMVQENVQAVIR